MQLGMDYKALFGSKLNNFDVKIHSSDAERTIDSAYAHILGLEH